MDGWIHVYVLGSEKVQDMSCTEWSRFGEGSFPGPFHRPVLVRCDAFGFFI